MKKILITGITGFAGQYLAEYLLETTSHTILGTYHSESSLQKVASLHGKAEFHQLDITDKSAVFKLISDVRPDEIYHLAAQSSASDSFKDPEATLITNILPQLYLLEALREFELFDTRMLVVSTSEVYGLVKPDDLPIDEEIPLRPASPYAVSKLTQDLLSQQYFFSHKLSIIRVRPFNHIGPRQQPKFVLPMFAKQIAEIEKGLKEPIMKVGNLTAKKDFTDVRDMVKAYALLLEKGTAGDVYNIGSGSSTKIQDLLDMLLSFTDIKISVEVDQNLFRPVDIPDLVCDHSKVTSLTGWVPEIPLEKTVKDTLDYFRQVV